MTQKRGEISAAAADVHRSFVFYFIFDSANRSLIHRGDAIELAGVVSQKEVIIFAIKFAELFFIESRRIEQQAASSATAKHELAGIMVLWITRAMQQATRGCSANGAGFIFQ